MRNTLKVAKWEVKRNLKNKSFIIGLFITPIIFALFMIIPSFFSDSEPEQIDVYVKDDLNIIQEIEQIVEQTDFLNWNIHETSDSTDVMSDKLAEAKNTAYIHLTDKAISDGVVPVYMSDDLEDNFINQMNALEGPLRDKQLAQFEFTEEERDVIFSQIVFEEQRSLENLNGSSEEQIGESTSEADPLKRIIPGVFAGIILFSIVISGMMIFQSASQEKKDKIAEIILSSVTPNDLMQGKIIGYFVLGIIQVFVWLAFAIPLMMWQFSIPIFEYLLVPELAILLIIAVLGYLLFASIFVGIGATVEDVSTSGNFQGMVIMLPFLPFILMGPILSDVNGVIAKFASYIPLTSPGILILRLTMLDEWPWMEIIISIAILMVSVWLFMKLAGKIFKTGILLYGKNATPKEIWKWMRT